MDRLTYLKGQRSLTRKQLKKYLVMFRDEISAEVNIEFPEADNIRNFDSEEFDKWFETVLKPITTKCKDDLILLEIIECYICAYNNVASEEATKNDIYY